MSSEKKAKSDNNFVDFFHLQQPIKPKQKNPSNHLQIIQIIDSLANRSTTRFFYQHKWLRCNSFFVLCLINIDFLNVVRLAIIAGLLTQIRNVFTFTVEFHMWCELWPKHGTTNWPCVVCALKLFCWKTCGNLMEIEKCTAKFRATTTTKKTVKNSENAALLTTSSLNRHTWQSAQAEEHRLFCADFHLSCEFDSSHLANMHRHTMYAIESLTIFECIIEKVKIVVV